MKTAKRLIAYFLVLTLMIGAMPTSVLAADDTAVENSVASVDNGNLAIEGSNGFGNLLSEEIAEQQEAVAEGASSGYTVTALEIEGNVATVTYDSLEEATLVVALYTEDGLQMLLSGSTTVLPEETTATVTLEGDMPQYFLASAYLLDSYDMSPLCPSYDTPLYTKEMQELLASTVDDYDADRVLNLDEDNTTNFAVYAEDTIVIEPVDGVNTVVSVDDDTLTYVIKNADSAITGLKTGDVFAYPYDDGEILIVKVAAITVKGTTATITGADVELEDIFGAVKIESYGSTGDMIVDDSTASEGITYIGTSSGGAARSLSGGDVELKQVFDIDFKDEVDEDNLKTEVTVKGSLDLQLTAGLKYYVALDEQYIEFKANPSVTASVTVSGSITKKASLGYFAFSPVPGLYVGFEPELQLSFSGAISCSITLSMVIGVRYDSSSGLTHLTSNPVLDGEFKAEVQIFFGIDLGPQIRIISEKIAKLELTTLAGFELTVKSNGTGTQFTTEKNGERHTCKDCLAMEFVFKGELTGSIRFLNMDKATIKINFANLSIPICDAYYSSDYDEFAFTKCPHISYRTTIAVLDTEGNPVRGAIIMKNQTEKLGTTNKNGNLVEYLPFGGYLFSTQVDGVKIEKKAEVLRVGKITLEASEPKDSFWESVEHTEITDEGFGVVKVRAKIECGWEKAYAYTWGDWELGDWPGTEMTRNGDWFEVDMTGNHVHIIISNGESLTQTADVSIEMGVDVWITVQEDWQVSVSYGAQPSEDGYTCGSRLRWSVAGDTLTISGSGRMSGYPFTDAPWTGYASQIKKVVIDSGVTWVDKSVFADCYNLEKIVFSGDAPAFLETSFEDVTAYAYYPEDNDTWTSGDMQDWGGSITWVSYKDINNLEGKITVYAKVPDSWGRPGAYTWNDEDLGQWPGSEMSFNGEWYEIQMPGYHNTLIINDYVIGGEQTDDLIIDAGKDVWVVVDEDSFATVTYKAPQKQSQIVLTNITSETSVSYGVFGGSYETVETENYNLKTSRFEQLVPNHDYVLLVLDSDGMNNEITPDNLLYIDQATADEKGVLTFQYGLSKKVRTTYVMACGPSNKDLADAIIRFPEMQANGETALVAPVVTYDGKVLTENVDYVIVGDVDYEEAGEYTCYIRGIYQYTGLVRCDYRVASAGVSVSGKVASFGELDAVTVTLLRDGTELRSVTADSEGLYSVGEVAPGTYTLRISKENHITRTYTVTVAEANVTVDATICLIGDVNADGKVNMKDWNIVYLHVNELQRLSGYALECADVNNDGKVNLKDWNRMYQHISETAPLW